MGSAVGALQQLRRLRRRGARGKVEGGGESREIALTECGSARRRWLYNGHHYVTSPVIDEICTNETRRTMPPMRRGIPAHLLPLLRSGPWCRRAPQGRSCSRARPCRGPQVSQDLPWPLLLDWKPQGSDARRTFSAHFSVLMPKRMSIHIFVREQARVYKDLISTHMSIQHVYTHVHTHMATYIFAHMPTHMSTHCLSANPNLRVDTSVHMPSMRATSKFHSALARS